MTTKPSERIDELVQGAHEHPHVVVLHTAVAKILDEMREDLDELQAWRNSVDGERVPVQGSMEGESVSVHEMHSWVGMHTCLTQWQSKLEVIGNIFESPSLLKEKPAV